MVLIHILLHIDYFRPRCDFDIVRLTAKAVHPGNGRYLEVYSNQNGCQFYTATFLPNVSEKVPAKLVIGKGNTKYEKCGSFCFETQNFPDAVNHVSRALKTRLKKPYY